METVNLFIHLLTCYLCYLNISFTDVERSPNNWRETGWIIRTTRLWWTKEKAARWVWYDIFWPVIFQSPPDGRTRNSEQYFLLRCGVVIRNLPICIWRIISLRLSFPLVIVRRLILSFPERGCSQISTKNSKFHFVKCWNTNCTDWKYCQRGLVWMVTLQDFLRRLKSWLHHLVWEGKGQVVKWPARKSFKTLLFDFQRISKKG